MSKVQLVSVTEEADLNFTWSVLNSWRQTSNDMTKFKVDYIEEAIVNRLAILGPNFTD